MAAKALRYLDMSFFRDVRREARCASSKGLRMHRRYDRKQRHVFCAALVPCLTLRCPLWISGIIFRKTASAMGVSLLARVNSRIDIVTVPNLKVFLQRCAKPGRWYTQYSVPQNLQGLNSVLVRRNVADVRSWKACEVTLGRVEEGLAALSAAPRESDRAASSVRAERLVSHGTLLGLGRSWGSRQCPGP